MFGKGRQTGDVDPLDTFTRDGDQLYSRSASLPQAVERSWDATKDYLNHWYRKDKNKLRQALTDGVANKNFRTPIMLATATNNFRVVELLLSYHELLGLGCTLSTKDGTRNDHGGDDALDIAINNYDKNKGRGDDAWEDAWEILKVIIRAEFTACSAEDYVDAKRTIMDHDGMVRIVEEKSTNLTEILGFVEISSGGPSTASFEHRLFDAPATLQQVLHDLEEMALSQSSARKQMSVERLEQRYERLSAADRSSVAWLREDLIYILDSIQ